MHSEGNVEKSRILIFGSTGYLGNYLTRTSISMGHPTYEYVRPAKPHMDPSRLPLLQEFKSMGVSIFQGELDEHAKVVEVIKKVDIVISALGVPQYLDQMKIISAMKESGNVKRFIPAEYGNEVDRESGALPPFQKILDKKKKIRRATEEAGIPYTIVCANSLASYFVSYFLHPHDLQSTQITIYGTGQTKAILTYEEDVAVYTLRAVTDPRTENRVIVCRPSKNIVSQLDLVTSWEKLTGRKFQTTHISEQQLIHLSQNLPFPDNIPPSILHGIFVKGVQTSYDLSEEDLEASKLYPDHTYTSIHQLLSRCLIHPPTPKLATFA